MIFFYGILFIIAVTFLWVISTNEYARLVQEGKSRPRAFVSALLLGWMSIFKKPLAAIEDMIIKNRP
ncbi:hypothetical protein U7537_08175 [Lacticaseibacillus rhamnosus]